MSNYIETVSNEGQTVRIEVSDDHRETGFARPGKSGAETSPAAQQAYQQMLDTIRVCANGMIDTIQGLASQPSGASLDFGIKIDGEAGAMIAKSIGDGQFKVSLSWRQAEPDKEKDEAG
jgi:hypothetical protein